jgi:hypothetical protein
LQSISGVGTNNPLVAFEDIHRGKRGVLFFYFIPDITRDIDIKSWVKNIFLLITGSKVRYISILKQNSLYCMAPKIYNKIPKHLKNLNIAAFRNKLKILSAAKAYYNLTEFFMDKL